MTPNQTIDDVPREFVREGRYIVVKPDYEDDIRTERLRNYIEEMCFHTPDCVVVEADWPEYEPVWRMIEARVIGNPTELDAAKATISQLQGLVAELRALLDAPAVPVSDYEGAAKWVEKRMDDYINEHGNEDPETGSLELPGTGDEYVAELMEIAEGLRALKAAAQPQGEPVHQCQKCNGRGTMPTRHAGEGETDYRTRCKLYAEQPAPVAVAVVMPERKTWDGLRATACNLKGEAWNACLDEVTRLNGVKP